MGNKLVIVESPAKARTIGKILGDDYILMASMGHVRDLPERSLGVDVNNEFTPDYKITKSKTMQALNAAAKNAEEIFLATDPDREGEAIAWHLKEVLSKKTKAGFCRVEFHEITKSAINKAFESPREIDFNLVDSQQARRILDRLVGYQVSPLLWSRIERGASAGRVQSVALRIVCEKEREIQKFIPQEYWNFNAQLLWKNDKKNSYFAKLFKINDKKAEVPNVETADKIYNSINESRNFEVDLVKIEPVKRYAQPPFITSTLQQAGGTYLRFAANKTMRVAQQLYEGTDIGGEDVAGLITYMRTDSFSISNEAQNACREFILSNYGERFIPAKPNFFKNKKTAQEAHEAIRPTNVMNKPEDIAKYLDRDQLNLYRLIWKRFVGSQMAPAEITRTTIDTSINPATTNEKYTFRTVASVTDFPGFTKMSLGGEKEEQPENSGPGFLKMMKKGDESLLDKLDREQKFTEPPSRYTEPSLIKELESNGIGRPSTYATIVNTIQKRKYVEKIKGKLIPEELGFNVNDYLVSSLPNLFDVGFTAEMETKLDDVEAGSETWTKMLGKFYGNLSEWLESVKYKSAPDKDKVVQLLALMNKVTDWKLPEKRGRRTYDDNKFFISIQKQFDKNGKLSEKQWDSLVNLSLEYTSQLKDFEQIAEEYSFNDKVNEIKQNKLDAKNAEKKFLEENKDQIEMTREGLKFFKEIEFPAKEGAGFNEGEFIQSLIARNESNKPLTPKQQKVLNRIAVSYKAKISNFDKMATLLGITEEEMTESNNDPKIINEINELLNKLSAVEKWNEPVKKGRRVYDDQAFFQSLKDQFERRKNLSVKQVAALKKIVAKYKNV